MGSANRCGEKCNQRTQEMHEVVFADICVSPRVEWCTERQVNDASCTGLWVPLFAEPGVVGVIELFGRDLPPVSGELREELHHIGNVMGAALEKVQARAEQTSLGANGSAIPVTGAEHPTVTSHAHDDLSKRERQVFEALAMGKSVSDLARELSLSKKTISTYRARVLVKLRLRTTAELMRYAFRCGLVR